MKHRSILISLLVVILLLLLTVGGSQAQEPAGDINAQALGTAFTYQGRLTDGGSPANGEYDFQFRLYNGNDGSEVGSPISQENVSVTEGGFTVQLDFGNVFDGTPLLLGISVRPGSSSGAYTTLSPRQPLTPAPYAHYAAHAPWSGLSDVPAGLDDGDDDTTYTAGTGLALSGGEFSANTSYLQRRVSSSCATGSAIRVISADGTVTCQATGGGGVFWSLSGNSGTTSSNFLGTTDNQALELRVNGARALRLEPDPTSPNLIGGYSGNSVTPGVMGATIGGGGNSSYPNQVTANYGTISGGNNNTASGDYAAVGGGWANSVSKDYATVGGGINNAASGNYASVGGGQGNTASGEFASVGGGQGNTVSGSYASVGGGQGNTASGYIATIGGGVYNTASAYDTTVSGGSNNTAGGNVATVGGGTYNDASGDYATVSGGNNNTASGNYSFAAGRQAKANHDGAFVWADSTFADFTSDRNNQFKVRASGGAWFEVSGSSGLNPAALRVESTSSNGVAIHARQTSSDATLVVGNRGTGDLIKAFGDNGSGGSTLRFQVDQAGNVRADGTYYGAGYESGSADFAEMVRPGQTDLVPGDVLVVGPDGRMVRSSQAYQTSVVGVYSTEPGFIGDHKLDEAGNPLEPERIPLAVLGIVPVKASTENGPIQPGDLLVTSATPGHAMRADLNPPTGTVIGKALEGLDAETGVIQMLVILQ